jgi:hypothetical protein
MRDSKAAMLSPLLAFLAAPLYGAWLYLQWTSTLPLSPGPIGTALNIAVKWTIMLLPLVYALVYTYGWAFHITAQKRQWTGPVHYAVAGALPGLLSFLLPFDWQDSIVPGVLFGVLTALFFWGFTRKHSTGL